MLVPTDPQRPADRLTPRGSLFFVPGDVWVASESYVQRKRVRRVITNFKKRVCCADESGAMHYASLKWMRTWVRVTRARLVRRSSLDATIAA